VGFVSQACEEVGSRLIFISTDYVFDGTADRPYTEDSRTNPINVYGQSKLGGEQATLNCCHDSLVVRTAWLFGKHGKNFVNAILRRIEEVDRLDVVCDQVGSPTYTVDLSHALLHLIDRPLTPEFAARVERGVLS